MLDSESDDIATAVASSGTTSTGTENHSNERSDNSTSVRVAITKHPNGFAIVQPACEDLLRPILSYEEVQFRHDASGRVFHTTAIEAAYVLEGDGLAITNGCVSRVEQCLKRCGHEVSVIDHRRPDTHFVLDNASRIEHMEERFPGLAARLQSHREGIIEVGTGRRHSEMIAAICQLSPQTKFLVASRTIEAARELAENLRTYLGPEVEAVHGHNWWYSCRVVCGTFGSLDRSDPQDWDVLIFADAFDGIQKTNNSSRGEFVRRTVYALVDPRRPRSQSDELRLEILAGEVIYRDSKDRQPARGDLSVAFATHSSPGFSEQECPRERRISLRSDEHRNRAIAELATALSTGDATSGRSLELNLPGTEGLPALGSDPGVIVMVDSVEHGEQLRRLLPSWHLYDGRPSECLTSTERRSAETWGVPRNSIVTAVAATTLHSFSSRILIWASGGARPFIPQYFQRLPVTSLLIDFWDHGNGQLAKDTQDRLRFYRSISCCILGNDLAHQERLLTQQIASRHPGSHQNTSRRPRRSNRSSV